MSGPLTPPSPEDLETHIKKVNATATPISWGDPKRKDGYSYLYRYSHIQSLDDVKKICDEWASTLRRDITLEFFIYLDPEDFQWIIRLGYSDPGRELIQLKELATLDIMLNDHT